MFSILFLGDIVGRIGRKAVKVELPRLQGELKPDLVIANGENAAGGIGLDVATATEIFNSGVEIITSGNHVWKKKDFNSYLDSNSERVIRPQNYAPGAPGKGWTIWKSASGLEVGVLNLIGRVFMPDLVDCPFRVAKQTISEELSSCKIILVDFHAEATSEKVAMGYALDGRVSAILGTHTHVQTADARVLPGGSAHLTDVGMCGPRDSVIGVRAEQVLKKFETGIPVSFDVAKGPAIVNGAFIEIDEESGKALSISPVYREIIH